MNLEDDIIPARHFVRETFAYVQERETGKEDWSSLQVEHGTFEHKYYIWS